jgi:hypothetical protein
MKIYQHLIPSILMASMTMSASAETLINHETPVENYISVTGFLGTRADLDSDEKANNHPEFSQAIALNWAYEENSEGELFFSNSRKTNQGVDIYVQYLHFGGRILFQNSSPLSASIALGAGATYFHPEGDTYDDDFAFSASMAAGLRYQLDESFALRSDLRVYGTLLDDGRELFCYHTECDDDQYVEAELLVGLEYKF